MLFTPMCLILSMTKYIAYSVFNFPVAHMLYSVFTLAHTKAKKLHSHF